MTSAPESFAVPSPDQCWVGDWTRPEPKDEMWALAAVGRTVHVLPALHPWRLGDSKGSGRVLLWVGKELGNEGIAVLTRMGVDPDLQTGDDTGPYQFDAWSMLDAAHQVALSGEQPCWLGGLAKIEGAWLPGLAVLPRALRELDDPGTAWSTESVDFASAFTVQATDTRFAADVLAPHVMALILDHVPKTAAVTMAGDALHVWLPYSRVIRQAPGLAQQLVEITQAIRDAIPGFIYTDHPDRSDLVEADLAAKQGAAEQYRANRRLGHSNDPALQRIYDQARAQWEAGNVSSKS